MTGPVTTSSSNTGIRVDVVRIARFRSLRNVEVQLADRALLVGMNNAGKTSFLRALHLALGLDRRLISMEDFSLGADVNEAHEILIDVRIVPVDGRGARADTFAPKWVDNDLGNGVIQVDAMDREFAAIRTRISRDAVKSDIAIERFVLRGWSEFSGWQKHGTLKKIGRFEQLASFFIDAQRDVVGDLRARSSYMGRLLSKVEIPDAAVAELEERIRVLNDDIVGQSEVLSHVRGVLAGLNRTVPAFGEGVEISPVSKNMRDLVKGVDLHFSDGTGSSFPLESHGMGTRSWASILSFDAYVSWTAMLADREGLPFHPVLFLEEPEAHLHPNAQRSVYGQLCKGSGQRIVSTHSPYIAGQAELEALVHFSKSPSGTVIRRLPIDQFDSEDIRKIRREILRSRGELLFARAVVLFEGETEEQAIPLFAQRHWNRQPFEVGVAFVGVGSDGNYAPFLRTFESIGIPWFVFSDGEAKARERVGHALEKVGARTPHPRVVTLPNNRSIEGYLFDEGYQNEIKQACIAKQRPFNSEEHKWAKTMEVENWNDAKLHKYLLNNKASMATHWAEAILQLDGDRSIPRAIRDLLHLLDTALEDSSKPTNT
jgi:putative ATP-dependent endonuclease of OLD family